jgi:protein SCO1/2
VDCELSRAWRRGPRCRSLQRQSGRLRTRRVAIAAGPGQPALSLGADSSQWRFATGDAARLKEMIGGGFEVYYAPDDAGGYRFDPTFVLMDGWGIIRGKYRYQVQVPDADRILRHIGVLAEEVQKSTGANKLIYEAAHLFLCYAP